MWLLCALCYLLFVRCVCAYVLTTTERKKCRWKLNRPCLLWTNTEYNKCRGWCLPLKCVFFLWKPHKHSFSVFSFSHKRLIMLRILWSASWHCWSQRISLSAKGCLWELILCEMHSHFQMKFQFDFGFDITKRTSGVIQSYKIPTPTLIKSRSSFSNINCCYRVSSSVQNMSNGGVILSVN